MPASPQLEKSRLALGVIHGSEVTGPNGFPSYFWHHQSCNFPDHSGCTCSNAKMISTQSKLIRPLDVSLKFIVVPPSSHFYVVSGHVSMTMVGIVTQLLVSSTAWSAF